MVVSLSQSAVVLTRIAAGKISAEDSRQGAKSGELALLKQENERIKGLVLSLENLKVFLENEKNVIEAERLGEG